MRMAFSAVSHTSALLPRTRAAEIAIAEGDTDTAVTYYQYAAQLGWSAAEEALAALGAETGE